MLEDMPGLRVDRKTIDHLRYAGCIILITENEKDFQNLLKNQSRKKRLDLNIKKTWQLVRKHLCKTTFFFFSFFFFFFWGGGGKARIVQAKVVFQKMRNLLTNKNISVATRQQPLSVIKNLFGGMRCVQ